MQSNIKTPVAVEEIIALRTLFEDYLRYTYWSEKTLATVFTELLPYIRSKDIVNTLTQHAIGTQAHSERLEQIFESIGIKPEEKKFDPIDSLINETEIIISQTTKGSVRDAAIIATIQHIIHCEIASYGTLKSFALTLKEDEVVMLLEKSLDEEKDFDLQLSVVAEAYINDEAANKEY